MLHLDSEIQYVKGVGPKRGALLRARGIHTVQDLLLRFPRRYEDRSHLATLDTLVPGQSATFLAKVYSVRLISTRSKGGILDVVLTDGITYGHAKWFNGGSLYRQKKFIPGASLVLTGKGELDKYDHGIVLFNPEFEVLPDGEPGSPGELGRYVPIYEEVSGITSRQLRSMVFAAFENLSEKLQDPLPAEMRSRYGLSELRTALVALHQPTLDDDIELLNRRRSPYHRRFIFEEFLLLELTLALRRYHLRSADGIQFQTNSEIRERLKAILPFHPTSAQKRAFAEIVDDLKATHPMNRLLQGDVGSGKTLVAFEAIVVAIENGYQTAMMVPTEILAEQHYISARQTLEPLGYRVAILRKGVGNDQPELLDELSNGTIDLAIGTHALLEDGAAFSRLGLVVIDEQHRFGVMQRLRLMEKGQSPNTLVMTATPIPRTLAMTFYGDLDVSVIDEMPPGRTPIRTVHIGESRRKYAESLLKQELEKGRQCYVVYPLIDESEKIDLRSATEGYGQLVEIFGNERVGLLHGRLKGEEKEAIMRAFNAGDIGILVSTTVVEVGVDVPNATLMLIEHAERFGMAQLHQLRGRVGRGTEASHCVLMTPDRIGDLARERVRAVAATTDGFCLAETDLRLRGPGELLGTRQSGIPEFRLADLVEDVDILVEARGEAERWVRDEPRRNKLIADLSRRAGASSLATVG
jgi:ATP-dependent DNA helicase RecG